MQSDDVLSFTKKGIYCPAGDFYIDPSGSVPRALITHGHADHARRGHGSYLATHAALPIIRHRLGRINAEGLNWGETRQIGDVRVSFHPAGHVPGSAQIKVEQAGQVWVVSGDYKLEDDGLSEAFEPVKCHSFITECTFGLPIFRWPDQHKTAADMVRWWNDNARNGKVSVIGAYGLGKAQRIMVALARQGLPGPIFTHPAVEVPTQILRGQGYDLPPTTVIDASPVPRNALIIAPPSAQNDPDIYGPHEVAFASGWTALKRRRGPGTGFVMSDHADWDGLNRAIRETGASRVIATHGYTTSFQRWLESQGYEAGIINSTKSEQGTDPIVQNGNTA